jgi:hypothetical protein
MKLLSICYDMLQVLQERDPAKIAVCKEYMHYLMTGLQALPSYSPGAGIEAVLWRGVNRLDGNSLQSLQSSVLVQNK